MRKLNYKTIIYVNVIFKRYSFLLKKYIPSNFWFKGKLFRIACWIVNSKR